MAATLVACDTAVLIAGFKNVLKYMPQKLKEQILVEKSFFSVWREFCGKQ